MFTLFSRLKQCYQFVKYSCPLIFHRYHLDTFYCDECGPCWRNNCMTLMITSTWQYTDSTFWEWPGSVNSPWASYQIRKIAGRACAGNAGNVFARRRIQRKPRVSDLGMHHGTCVRHMSWCMSGSLTRGGGENVPGIPGACAPAILRIWQETHGEGTTGPLFTKRTDVLPQNQGPFSVSYLFPPSHLTIFYLHPYLEGKPSHLVKSQVTLVDDLDISLATLTSLFVVCIFEFIYVTSYGMLYDICTIGNQHSLHWQIICSMSPASTAS